MSETQTIDGGASRQSDESGASRQVDVIDADGGTSGSVELPATCSTSPRTSR